MVSSSAETCFDTLHPIRTRIDGMLDSNRVRIGLVNGLNEVCKALDRKDAVVCVLAENCQDPKYSKLVTVSASDLSASTGSR